jgi:predicted membrane protein
LVGPLLGLLVTVAPRQVHRATLGIGPAFGFGFGGFVGLVVALAILLVRRQFTPQTALVAVATLVVGIWLALSFQ